MNDNVTAKTTMTLGCTIRSTVISTIKNEAFQMDIDCNIDEDRFLFESHYRLKLTGSRKKVEVFYRKIQTYINQINDD